MNPPINETTAIAEAGIISACCCADDPERVKDIIAKVRPHHFFGTKHQIIYDAICGLVDEGEPVDELTVAQRLESAAMSDKVGGLAGIMEITGQHGSHAQCPRWIDAVLDASARRQIIRAASRAVEIASDPGYDLGEAKAVLKSATAIETSANIETLAQCGSEGLPKTYQELDAIKEEPLIPDIVGHKTKMIIGGSAKAGKTFFALGMSIALARGDNWLGRQLKPHKVLYVDLELRPEKLAERVFRIAERHGIIDLPDTFMRLPLREHPQHRNRDVLAKRIRAEVKAMGGCHLIVIDCLYRILDGLDENASGDMTQLGAWLDTIVADTGSAIAVVHHFGKGGGTGKDSMDRFRGSSALAGEFDALLTLTAHEQQDNCILEGTLRDFAGMPAQTILFDYPRFVPSDLPPKMRKPGASVTVSDESIAAFIPRWPDQGMTAADIAKRVGLARTTMIDRLNRMAQVDKIQDGRRILYRLKR